MYIVSTMKIFVFALVMGAIAACSSICYFEYTRYVELPIVQYDKETCKNVVNFKNGDAYNCNDVNVLLRKFRKANVIASDVAASEPATASSPVTSNEKAAK